jgi:hypothetical protein
MFESCPLLGATEASTQSGDCETDGPRRQIAWVQGMVFDYLNHIVDCDLARGRLNDRPIA